MEQEEAELIYSTSPAHFLFANDCFSLWLQPSQQLWVAAHRVACLPVPRSSLLPFCTSWDFSQVPSLMSLEHLSAAVPGDDHQSAPLNIPVWYLLREMPNVTEDSHSSLLRSYFCLIMQLVAFLSTSFAFLALV